MVSYFVCSYPAAAAVRTVAGCRRVCVCVSCVRVNEFGFSDYAQQETQRLLRMHATNVCFSGVKQIDLNVHVNGDTAAPQLQAVACCATAV